MKRFVLGVMVVLGGAAALPFGASASTPPTTAPAAASKLKGFVCQTATTPAQRAMSVTAVMGHLDGTAKLQMRFQLVKRAKRHGMWAPVTGPGLKSWISPKDPTLGTRTGDTWIVKHPVVNLTAPAYYRIKVGFRWLDSQGQVIATAYRHSPVCFQPQLQPDLKVVKAWANPVQAGSYGAKVQDASQTRSTGYTFDVTRADGTSLLAHPEWFPPIRAEATKTISVSGASCDPGEPLEITVEPDNMDDADPANDTLDAACPSAAASPARADRGR